jgi:hypothetical protein
MKKFLVASALALFLVTAVYHPAAKAQDNQAALDFKNEAEATAYTNAISQTDAKAKAAAIETFLQIYPNSIAKKIMLSQLIGAYNSFDAGKALESADKLAQADPTNLQAIYIATHSRLLQAKSALVKNDTATAKTLLDAALPNAKLGIAVKKPAAISDAQFNGVLAEFHETIGLDALQNKDYATAETEISVGLNLLAPDQQTGLAGAFDALQLANAYVGQTPQDLINASWYFARAWNYLPDAAKPTVDQQGSFWFKRYHGKTDGWEAVKLQAKGSVAPPAGFTIAPAPSPAELAHQALIEAPDPTLINPDDKEYILFNGSKDTETKNADGTVTVVKGDASKLFDAIKGKGIKVEGLIITLTDDTVTLAVSEDLQEKKVAEFTIKLAESLTKPAEGKKPAPGKPAVEKKVPAVGDKITLIGAFDSFTQTPPMITLVDGQLPEPEKPAVKKPAAAVHHHAAH